MEIFNATSANGGPWTEVPGNNRAGTLVHIKVMSRAKHWVFTLNNYTTEEELYYSNLVSTSVQVVYLGFGREVGGELGTPHLQGLASLQSRHRLAQVRSLFPRCHLEVRRGTHVEAKQYASKDGAFEEWGDEPVGQGSRTDLQVVQESLDNGASMRDISDEYFSQFVRYERSFRSYINMHTHNREFPPSVIVYWGATGTGKTKAVWDNLSSPDDLWQYPGAGWFDGYIGQPIVLFDDFHGGELRLTMLLKVLDRYPMQVQVKGGFANWKPREIYLTSNLNPNSWYSNAHDEHQRALTRRFTNVVQFEHPLIVDLSNLN